MMALKIDDSGPKTFTTSERDERGARQHVPRLTGPELQDLRDLWTGLGPRVGVGSPQLALENSLLRAPPRDVSGPLLEELDRWPGWVSEGRVFRVVMLEGWGLKRELRRSLAQLVDAGKVERRALVAPELPPPTRFDPDVKGYVAGRSPKEQERIDDWDGFEVRSTTRLALKIVPLERAEKWRRQDEALEREWRIVHGTETRNASTYEPPDDPHAAGARRARAALAKLSERHEKILRTLYAGHGGTDESGIDAVRALVGGEREAAIEVIGAACAAYRQARRS
ncbi:MAG TPA: hypothetical protein VGH28_13920 [Polyangiaceae bacterium]|jgi:hypothetical protein